MKAILVGPLWKTHFIDKTQKENIWGIPLKGINYHTIIRAAFVCVFVCFLSPPRSFGRSSPNLLGVCRLTSHLPLRGSFSKRSTAQRVTFAFHYIIYVPASLHTLQRHLLLGKQQSLIRRLLLSYMSTTYVGGPGNCYWGVLFLKGQRVKWVSGSLSLSLYYIW